MRLASSVLALVIAGSASAVTMDWTPIGNPGNSCEVQPPIGSDPGGCFGSVDYAYSIGTYEVTNAQYAEFLNAKAKSDPLRLYTDKLGIARDGPSGSYTYTVIAGRGEMPVNYISYYDAMRFANWLHNGQGDADTETGSYTLLGGTRVPSNAHTVMRNAWADIVLPSVDEWYKAAYYDAATASYFEYPTGTNVETTCSVPTATANTANCDNAVDNFTIKGSYTNSAGPYGTFDQGGNASEWVEAPYEFGRGRKNRGANFVLPAFTLSAPYQGLQSSTLETGSLFQGFRLAMVPATIPEPGTGLLVAVGLVGIAVRRRLA